MIVTALLCDCINRVRGFPYEGPWLTGKKETIQESTDRVMAAACRYRDAVESVRVNRTRVENLQAAVDESQQKLSTWEKELDEARKELHRAALRE